MEYGIVVVDFYSRWPYNIQLSESQRVNCRIELRKLLWAVRTTPNVDTGVSDFVLLTGRVTPSKMTRQWMGEFAISKHKIDDVGRKRLQAQDRYVGVHGRKSKVVPGDCVK